MRQKCGFSLIEMAIVIAIIAILAAVGIPAYVNHKNRAIQAEAVEALLRGKMDQELFFAENNRYATTIGCLPSFGPSCDQTTYSTPNNYIVKIVFAVTNPDRYRITASKMIYGQADTLAVTESSTHPILNNPDAIKISIFDLLFD